MLETFFTTEKGLTITSAQHLANLAREEAKRIEERLSATSFVNQDWSLLSVENWLPTKIGCSETEMNEMPVLIERVAQMYAYVAWVGEAIHVREEAILKIESKDINTFCKEHSLTYPTENIKSMATETTIMNEMNVKDRAEYLTLEAYASAYGKFIHDKMPFNEARKALALALTQPYEPKGEGKDCIVVRKSPSVDAQEVERMFQSLQAGYRQNERSLNAIKTRIRQAVAERNRMVSDSNKASIRDAQAERAKIDIMYRQWKADEVERVSKLKMLVPLSLQATVDELNAMSELK